jgi:hypothetical protein
MPIDLSQVNWLYVAVLTLMACLASVVGNLLSFNHRGIAAFLTAVTFAVMFVAYSYYPHGLPLPTTLATKTPAVAPAPAPVAVPAAPQRPRNPVTDITPPSAPR